MGRATRYVRGTRPRQGCPALPHRPARKRSPKGGVRGQQRWYNRHMASSYRTNDGHTVRIGSTVWGVNGQGPFTLVEPESAPEGWVSVVSADGEDWRLHAPEDIALYYVTTRP